MSVRFFRGAAFVFGCAGLFSAADCKAADPVATTPSLASELLSDALQAEMNGEVLVRERLLTAAEQMDPVGHSHLGFAAR